MRGIVVPLVLSVIYAHGVLAHEGKTHGMGTVAAADAQHAVVTDREGKTISVSLTKDTKYEQGDVPAQASAENRDLPGIDVVDSTPTSFRRC